MSSEKATRNAPIIGVVCHDAGGAEVVSAWLQRGDKAFRCCLAGPAVQIFERKFGNIINQDLEFIVKGSDWVLCGSSWQSDLEKTALSLCYEVKKRAVVFLDHWVNYRERFILDGVPILPDEVWVGDRYALAQARDIFSSIPVTLVENPYLIALKKQIKAKQKSKLKQSIDILYVCEPVREHARLQFGDDNHLGYTEETALRFFFANIHLICEGSARVTIRPHPSESVDKYDWALAYSNESLLISLGGTQTLLNEILSARFVVGCESMAMVIGVLAKRTVYSSIPPGGRPCSLPHEQIFRLQDLVETNNHHYD